MKVKGKENGEVLGDHCLEGGSFVLVEGASFPGDGRGRQGLRQLVSFGAEVLMTHMGREISTKGPKHKKPGRELVVLVFSGGLPCTPHGDGCCSISPCKRHEQVQDLCAQPLAHHKNRCLTGHWLCNQTCKYRKEHLECEYEIRKWR